MKKEKEDLGSKYDAEHKQVCNLDNQLKQVRKELEQLQTANGDLKAKMADKSQEKDRLEGKVKELSATMEQVRSDLDQEKGTVSKLKETEGSLTDQLKQARESLQLKFEEVI